MLGGKILAVIIIFGLIISILGKWWWLVLLLIVAWFIIRWLADLFWYGRDKGKW